MINFQEAGELLIELDKAQGKNEKRELLKQTLIESTTTSTGGHLWGFLSAALSPFITYGIKAPQPSTCASDGLLTFDSDCQQVLSHLADRSLTGKGAKTVVNSLFEAATPAQQRALAAVLDKNLRSGITISGVNACLLEVGLSRIEEFEVALADKFDSSLFNNQAMSQTKFDGVRCLSRVRTDQTGALEVDFFSRNGLPLHGLDRIRTRIITLVEAYCCDPLTISGMLAGQSFLDELKGDGWFFDGEVMGADFTETVGSVKRKGQQYPNAKFLVFDMIPAGHFVRREIWRYTNRQRMQMVNDLIGSDYKDLQAVVTTMIFSDSEEEFASEVGKQYDAARSNGDEGVIIKTIGGYYEYKRSKAWGKIKDVKSVDVEVTDVELADPKSKMAGLVGALVVIYNGVAVRVGSGLTLEMRKAWAKEPSLIIGQMVEVEFHEETPDGSLRHPRFKRVRFDKKTSDGPGV